MCVCVFLYICAFILVFALLYYLCVILSSMAVSAQVDLCDQYIDANALTSIFHMKSF